MACLTAVLAICLPSGIGLSYEINDQFSIGGVAAGVYQYQSVSDAPDTKSLGRGLLAFQPQISFTPTQHDELFVKFGFAAGNGLMEGGKSPFILTPWAGDTEDRVKNIDGRNRNYLLTAWYRHTFEFAHSHSLAFTAGIIDATDYVDDNVFANNEYTQFLNQALVNAPNSFVPSYDYGGVVEWQMGGFKATGLAMALGSNGQKGSQDEPYNAYFVELEQRVGSRLGEGTYRLLLGMSSVDFFDPQGTKKERRRCVLISFDQELGEILGAWIRMGWQDEEAAINYKNIYSGGLNIGGNLWGRKQDNIGIGYAHLKGGNLDADHTHVFETYIHIALTDIFAITGDIQYMKDAMRAGDSPNGWIFGLRATAQF